jgi:hypothetical protein
MVGRSFHNANHVLSRTWVKGERPWHDGQDDSLLDEVLGEACPDAEPPTKGEQIFRRQFHAQPPRYLIAVTAGEQ